MAKAIDNLRMKINSHNIYTFHCEMVVALVMVMAAEREKKNKLSFRKAKDWVERVQLIIWR